MLGLFTRRALPAAASAEAAYARIVAQSRDPALYRDHAVPDTVMGRFEMVVLHAFLYLHRLKGAGEEPGDVAQETFDRMFRDMDDSLREIGIGDLSVPKKIKAMAQSFYGRAEAYERALASEDAAALGVALARNVYGQPAATAEAEALAAYVRRAAVALAAQPLPEAIAEGPAFPPVVEASA